VRRPPSSRLAERRSRLQEAEETLRAIRAGEVDAVVVAGKRGRQVFTLEGAEHPYRVLIESMNEGALTVTADETILYTNQCFAGMVKCPLEQVTGGSFRRFLSPEDRATLRPLLKRPRASGSKTSMLLRASDGSLLPVQVSIRRLARNGSPRALVGVVVTDTSQARRSEEALRQLSQRLVQGQEAERGRVALELHDHVTQLLCATLFRCQALTDKLSGRGEPAAREAGKLREMVAKTAQEVERISRDLRPSVLDELGLVAVLRATGKEFAHRTAVAVTLSCPRLASPLPPDAELALFRILQDALRNVSEHARAHRVTVRLGRRGTVVRLSIRDDGIGFDPDHDSGRRKGSGHLGLLSMRERAAYVGGTLTVKSARRAGTEIEACIPLAAGGPYRPHRTTRIP
jgi:PAS domain S-box-containing protein